MTSIVPALEYAPYLRYDLARFDQLSVGQAQGGARPLAVVPGEWWLRLITVIAFYRPFDAVAVRIPMLLIASASGDVVIEILQLNGQQNTTVNTYMWSVDVGAPYGALNATQVAPCYSGLVPSGYTVSVYAEGGSNGDFIGPVRAFVQKVPTGPELSAQAPLLAPPLRL